MIESDPHCFCAIDAEVPVIEPFQFSQGGVKQPHAAAKRPALNVVLRRRELDQTLKKDLLLAGRLQPDFFPRFVRVPELTLVEKRDALLDGVHSDIVNP